RRLENERRTVAPFRLNDHHPEPIRPELVRERTAGREPAADETAARVLRPLRVDGAAAFAAEVARHARFHLVPADRALHPAVAAPLDFPGSLGWLFVCPTLLGLGHIYFHVSIHNLVGSLGEGDRTKNFSTFALGSSVAAAIGPAAAGFAIELGGFRAAFILLA